MRRRDGKGLLVEGLGGEGMVRGCWLRDYEETGW